MSQWQFLPVVVQTIFRGCLFMVMSREGTVGYCLNFKLWNEPCPSSCDQYTAATPGILEDAREKKFDIDCLEFTREKEEVQERYYCNLYKQTEPLCDACHFPRYLTDPFTSQ